MTAAQATPAIGALRVWWIPQLPIKPFHVAVASVAEGVKLMATLADYDLFQLENNVKPDYSNAGGLECYTSDCDGDGNPGWEGWCDDATGEDDPAAWLDAQPAASVAPAFYVREFSAHEIASKNIASILARLYKAPGDGLVPVYLAAPADHSAELLAALKRLIAVVDAHADIHAPDGDDVARMLEFAEAHDAARALVRNIAGVAA